MSKMPWVTKSKLKKSKKMKFEHLEYRTTPADPPEKSSWNTFPCTGLSGPGVDIACEDAAWRPRTSVGLTRTEILGEAGYRLYRWITVS